MAASSGTTWTLAKGILGLPVGPVFGNIWVTRSFHRLHLATGWPLSCSTVTNIDISEYCPLFVSSCSKGLWYGFNHGFSWRVIKHGPNHGQKKRIIGSLSFSFIFAIKCVLVAKWTIHGRTFGRPVPGGCMARIWQLGDRISQAGIFIYPNFRT